MINYTMAQEKDLEGIIQLLKINDLPFSDIQESQVEFIVAKNGNDIIGCIGLEKYDGEGLLRSFAVLPELQNKGIGRELYIRLLRYACDSSIKTLHLLTDTAKDYFGKIGFNPANRDNAPGKIRNSREFTALCPVSSTYMVLHTASEYAD